MSTPHAIVIGGLRGLRRASRNAARWMAGNIERAAAVWIADAIHCSVREQPERWRDLLGDFLG
ncbi:MAG: hypothetical protein ACREFY_11355 [Acetobacteraceae bacterium]